MPAKPKRRLTPFGRFVVFSAKAAACVALGLVGFCSLMLAVDPPSPAKRAAWAAQRVEAAKAEERRAVEARHQAWRQHVKDAFYAKMADLAVHSYSTSLSDLIGGFGTYERERTLEAVADNEEAAHPDAWKTYQPD